MDLEPAPEQLRSVHDLIASRKAAGGIGHLQVSISGLRSTSIQSLLTTVASTEDPLILWAAHLEATKRGIPPCLRGPKRDGSPQLLFFTWLADALWLAKNFPGYMPLRNKWANLFVYPTRSEKWQKTALWIFRSGHQVGFHHSKGLGLSDDQMQPLLTMQNNRMRQDRTLITKLPSLRERMKLDATNRPDKSGARTAEQISGRRAEILREIGRASCRERVCVPV